MAGCPFLGQFVRLALDKEVDGIAALQRDGPAIRQHIYRQHGSFDFHSEVIAVPCFGNIEFELRHAVYKTQTGKAKDNALPCAGHIGGMDTGVEVVMVIIQIHPGRLGKRPIRLARIPKMQVESEE